MEIIKSLLIWITGICYVIVTFPVNLITWLLTWPFDKNKNIIHWLLMHESMILLYLLPVWKVKIEGRKKARKGRIYVIISNHQSMLDIMLINCLRFKFKWVSKIENFKVPVIGWYLKMADYITVDRGNEESKIEMMERSLWNLRKNVSIMMFPEGTRSLDNEIGFFRRGAFQLALQANVPVLPVLIDGTGGILPKHGFIFGNGSHIRIRVLDPVNPPEFNTDNPDELAQRFGDLFKSELKKLRSEISQ